MQDQKPFSRSEKWSFFINAPACPHGTVPAIYLAQAAWAGYAESPGGSPLTHGWTVQIRIKTARNKDGNDWIIPPADSPYNFVDVRTSCERLNQRTLAEGK